MDRIFNQYVRRAGQIAPFFTSFCNGTTATCPGLSQWGTVGLANSGLTPLQILKRFYPQDIEIVESNIFAGIEGTYPGSPLRVGNSGLNVQIMQKMLNRIRRNYPAIPAIANENGVFGADTENAVRAFQRAFLLNPDGIIGKDTWYKISYLYVAVARLAELDSQGSNIGVGTVPPNVTLRQGSRGQDVITLQYILDYIAEFYPIVAPPVIDGIFGPGTARSVMDFQRMMNLTPDSIVGPSTWNALYDTYLGIKGSVRPPVTPPPPPPPPGNYINYTVRSGDNIWTLAQRFGTTMEAIRTLNNLTSDALSIGQVIRIPGSFFQYTVKSGDNLWLLAQRFGTTVDRLRQINNLASNALSIGQVLIIPGA